MNVPQNCESFIIITIELDLQGRNLSVARILGNNFKMKIHQKPTTMVSKIQRGAIIDIFFSQDENV